MFLYEHFKRFKMIEVNNKYKTSQSNNNFEHVTVF